MLLLRGNVPPLPRRFKRGGAGDEDDDERMSGGEHSDMFAFIIALDKRQRHGDEPLGRVKRSHAFMIALDVAPEAGGACAHVGISPSCVNCNGRPAQCESQQNDQRKGDDLALQQSYCDQQKCRTMRVRRVKKPRRRRRRRKWK